MKYFKLTLLLFLISFTGNCQGYLKANNKVIEDGNGHEVLLRGIGFGGWMLQEPYMLLLSGIADRDITKSSLWQSEANKQKTIALWKKLAEHYANEPWIGGYDLINETNWGFESNTDKNGCVETKNIPLRQLLMDITTAIRQVDKNHMNF